MMRVFRVSDAGWVPQALAAINAGDDVTIRATSADAKKIAAVMHDVTSRLPVMEAFKLISRFIPLPGGVTNFPVDPTTAVVFLATLGGEGAACAMVAFVGGVGVAHGLKLALRYDFGSLLDPMDDAVDVILAKPAP